MSRLFTKPGPAAVILLLITVTILGWARWVWNRVEPRVLGAARYQVGPEEIAVTPPPPWIRTDVKAQVVLEAGWDQPLSLLDPDLSEQVNRAFEFHPWIAKARTTLSYPARIEVAIRYRKPVAAVRLDVAEGEQLIPIDFEGVRLPSEDFTLETLQAYPQIIELGGIPVVGQRATDHRLLGAARLAALLTDDWQEFRLQSIAPADGFYSPQDTTSDDYQIFMQNGQIILWGAAPGNESEGEINAREKLLRLKQYAQDRTWPEDAPDVPVIDVRKLPALERTAQQPERESQWR